MSCLLFVDDDYLTLEAYDKIFSLAGHHVLIADSGVAALEIANNHEIDLIILDVYLSQKNSLDILRRLKSNQKTCAIPVVMTSANPAFLNEDIYLFGADYTISKPIFPDKLEEILSKSGDQSKDGFRK